jgi:hypothetical protein
MMSLGVEPATFQLVEQPLNQLRYRVSQASLEEEHFVFPFFFYSAPFRRNRVGRTGRQIVNHPFRNLTRQISHGRHVVTFYKNIIQIKLHIRARPITTRYSRSRLLA